MANKDIVDRPEKDMSMYPKPDMDEWQEIWKTANVQSSGEDDNKKRDDVDTSKVILYDTMPLRKPVTDRMGIQHYSLKFDAPTVADMKKFDKSAGSAGKGHENIGIKLGFESLAISCSAEPKLSTMIFEQLLPADMVAMMEKFNRNLWLGVTTN